ncbi:teneurihypothetical protein [Limosa lapponica baueri]|uniref:Teneurin N-terminal domain-containing protein n=1 Tax=Limosa lapponica baueri TaxID=1758121 RepID=A0A2I0TEA6_LIMLA|nr:teneurihypothetical protein [Limosa lapponica baueri]
MDIKDRRHRSLTRGRCGKECRYTSSSLDSEDCRVPTQKSYSSSETLKAYDHDTRMHYGNRVSDLVHRESDEFPRQVYPYALHNQTKPEAEAKAEASGEALEMGSDVGQVVWGKRPQGKSLVRTGTHL